MKSADEPGEWLMSRVAGGDRDCLNVLLRRYAPFRLSAFALRKYVLSRNEGRI